MVSTAWQALAVLMNRRILFVDVKVSKMRGLLACLTVGCGMWLGVQPAGAGDWPQFRGPDRNGISTETGLLRAWPTDGPKVLWSVPVCQGYAAATIRGDRVYFHDYDQETSAWMVRCLSLADGKELWRYTDKKRIRPNHGITRTVPTVDDERVYSLDPKCVLHCLDAATGELVWQKNLVREFKTRIPPWYAGQCPLIDGDRVIIAPGGEALIVALDKSTGQVLWQTPNPAQWPMSHASVMAAELAGVKQLLYCTLKGVVGVSAQDGKLLWSFPWKFNVAMVPSPLSVGDGRIFLTSGYEAGCVMLRVTREAEAFNAEEVYRIPAKVWNSEVHTPILYADHLFAVGKKKRGLFTCLDLDGNIVWTSEGKASFGLGSFMFADGMFFVLEGDTGMLRMIEASTGAYKELARAQVLNGNDVWAPMALANGKLVLRDMTRMVCVEVGGSKGIRASK